MKKLMTLLKISLVMLTFVVCIAIGKQQISDMVSHAISEEATSQRETTGEPFTSVANVLPTIAAVENIPAQTVADSSGMKASYKPLTGSGQMVETVEAATEPTRNYDFPAEMYPYAAMLTENEKLVYTQIYEAADARTDSVNLCKQLDRTGIENVMTAVFNDHPEFFWLETAYTYGYTNQGTVVSVTLSYNETAETIQSSRTAFFNAASVIINNASGYATDLEKEQSVYMQLQNLATYDEDSEMNQSAYSALVNQSTVCAGYARAFQYILQKLNIPCYFCSGYANGGNHAWNIVCIDGQYYNVDLSWDDTLGEATESISYSYFNLSDHTFGLDHTRSGLSIKLPACAA